MDFKQFLIKAKLSGYATGGEGKEIKLEDGGLKFYHQEQDLEYTDIYYGFNPFFGQEIVRKSGRTIWIMNYQGETDCDQKDIMSVYSFLKQALQNPDPDLPLRGPRELTKENFSYFNEIIGDMSLFSGEEIIKLDSNQVYKLLYHGGAVSNLGTI